MNLQQLKERREAIIEIASRNRAFNVAVFGSVARGEQTAESDVDFLVDFLPGSTLVDEYRLEKQLSDYLSVSVDLVPRAGLKPRDFSILEEAIPV
jgi:predicted nucleotidyltransferase